MQTLESFFLIHQDFFQNSSKIELYHFVPFWRPNVIQNTRKDKRVVSKESLIYLKTDRQTDTLRTLLGELRVKNWKRLMRSLYRWSKTDNKPTDKANNRQGWLLWTCQDKPWGPKLNKSESKLTYLDGYTKPKTQELALAATLHVQGYI